VRYKREVSHHHTCDCRLTKYLVYKAYNVYDASSYRISYSWCQQFINYPTHTWTFVWQPHLQHFTQKIRPPLKKTAVYWRYITTQYFRIQNYMTLVSIPPHTLIRLLCFYQWMQVVRTMLGSPPPARSSAGTDTHRQTAHKSHKPTWLS